MSYADYRPYLPGPEESRIAGPDQDNVAKQRHHPDDNKLALNRR